MSTDTANAPAANLFTAGPLGTVFARTALPIVFVMSLNGLLAVVDAVFLGVFVGPDALGAVTLMFPLYMLMVALATLVAGGMSSLLARHLGARRFDDARAVFAGAHGLALAVSAGFILLFLVFGAPLSLVLAAQSERLAAMGHTYLGILVYGSPLLLVVSVHSDALRNEGRAGLMAVLSLLISLSNIGFNYGLIVILDLGVAGSAYGTVLAWVLALLMIVIFRVRGRTELRPGALFAHRPTAAWGRILALGAPQSLNFIGFALVSAALLTALQLVESDTYATTVSAYGIISRVMTFVFLPLLGLSQALQSITGNNYGAALWQRSDDSLRLGMAIALVYCLVAEIGVIAFARPLAGLFVGGGSVPDEVARIVPMTAALFFASGPLMMIVSYFQAIGDAGRAAILGLTKPYAFSIPLLFLLPLVFGERGVWIAAPAAEALMLVLTAIVLTRTSARRELRWGLFKAAEKTRV